MSEREPRRDRDVQDYTDRFGREYEPRLSRHDEQEFADEAERKREEWQRAEQAELARRVEHALRAIDYVRELIPPGSRGAIRAVDYYMRRAHGLVQSLHPGRDTSAG